MKTKTKAAAGASIRKSDTRKTTRTHDATGHPIRTDAELLAMAARHDEAMLFKRLADRAEAGLASDMERKRLAELRRTSKEEPGFCPLCFHSEHERERYYSLKEGKRAADIATALDNVSAAKQQLSDALAAWVLQSLGLPQDYLSEDESRLLALIITPADPMRPGAKRYLSQRDIAGTLGVSAQTVVRREADLRKHKPIDAFLKRHKATRTPRGPHADPVTKRKKS